MKSLLNLMFSFRGRIGRVDFLLGHVAGLFFFCLSYLAIALILLAIFTIIGIGADPMVFATVPLAFLIIWTCLALAIKRFRDLGWMNIDAYIIAPFTLVPYLNLLFALQLFFFKGKSQIIQKGAI